MDAKYAGGFRLKGRELHLDNGLILLVCYRKKSTSTKSPVFLLDITNPLGRRHVSSLYDVEFESGGIRYRITRDGERGRIEALYARRLRPTTSRVDRGPVALSQASGRQRASQDDGGG